MTVFFVPELMKDPENYSSPWPTLSVPCELDLNVSKTMRGSSLALHRCMEHTDTQGLGESYTVFLNPLECWCWASLWYAWSSLISSLWMFPGCPQLPNLGSYSHQLYPKSKLFPLVGYCYCMLLLIAFTIYGSNCSIIMMMVMNLTCVVLYGHCLL